MKIMTDREFERRIQNELEIREKRREEQRWQDQRIEAAEKHMVRTLDRFEQDWNRRLARIEHALGLDRLTCGAELCEKPAAASCTPVNVESLC